MYSVPLTYALMNYDINVTQNKCIHKQRVPGTHSPFPRAPENEAKKKKTSLYYVTAISNPPTSIFTNTKRSVRSVSAQYYESFVCVYVRVYTVLTL